MDSVQNKTVMITGGAGGIGYKYAEVLLQNGSKSVAIIDLARSNGENAVTTLGKEFGKDRVIFYACDVTKAEDFEKTFQKVVNAFQGLDILINNAGMMNDNRLEQVIDLNLTALIRCSLLALDHMGKHKKGKGGVIANVSSILGLTAVNSGIPVYCASKYAVVGFTQNLANFYDYTGVRVVTMCPGVTLTPFIEDIKNKVLDFVNEEALDKLKLFPIQMPDNVALAMLDLIRKGKNGEIWVSEAGQPPYAVQFPHYSELSVSVSK